MAPPEKNKEGEIVFKDHPDFRPNLTPREIFQLGSFGGTYWRPIHSSVTGKNYRNVHRDYPKEWWKGIPEDHLTRPWDRYDPAINRYGVEVGTTLEFWEEKGWITHYHPYGWLHWYCSFYAGERCPDDERQIDRWKKTAGPNSRFRKWLVRLISEKSDRWDDEEVSPKIRQTLQHWSYQLTERDYDSIKEEMGY
jgi:hypothetical protein